MTDADVLPAFLGGMKTDPDGNPLCKSFNFDSERRKRLRRKGSLRKVKEGKGRLFKDRKYQNVIICAIQKKKLSKAPDAEKLTVTRLSKEERCFEVEEPGSYLEWEFETKTKDIGFVIYFKGQPESLPVELIPKQRIDTCYEPEKGLFRCEKPGKYVVVFDNSYSWMYPKEIYYRARIISPKDNETFYN
ncbi:SEC14-like protein 2 [Caerostris extrusa]|uniref:SEC14-like protein 2 n=1 Tax=Caerostris extrusa TaxID=172846 RepID=A0AAV4MGW0_CAEEX|nr:SEC14-like protein 2 [Caerostris extrusa]